MSKLFPVYKDITETLLCFLHISEATEPAVLYDKLADYFDLSQVARTISRGEYFGRDDHPQLAWHCLVQWGRRDLKKADLIDVHAPRGIWRLNHSGHKKAEQLLLSDYSTIRSTIFTAKPKTLHENNKIIIPNGILATPKVYDLNRPEEFPQIKYTVYRILRDTRIAREVKSLYKHRCQICNITIDLGDGHCYAECHHVKPIGSPHLGPDIADNVVCVCPLHHVLLDYGVIEIKVADLYFCGHHNVRAEFIEYHNTQIYNC